MEHSPEIGELMAALAKARKVFLPVLKHSKNPYFGSTYADLAEYIDATKDGLSDNGIAVTQFPEYDPEEGGVTIITFIAHPSNQWMLDRLWVPVSKGDAQGIGSAITYGRRYAYSALLNVASQGEDDDANQAVGKTQTDRSALTTDKDEKKGRTINPAQQRALWSAFKSSGKTEADFRGHLSAKYGLEHTSEILKKDLDYILRWLMGTKIPNPGEELTPDLEASLRNVQEPAREPGSDDEPELASPPLDFKNPYVVPPGKRR
jgi:hypothetical protein